MITQNEAIELFDYDRVTGELRWKNPIPSKYFEKPAVAKMVNSQRAGKLAANVNKSTGYLQVVFRKRLYQVHRVIWLIVFGNWPKNQIDHINRVRTDNRIENLREACLAKNMLNRGDNSTGHPNISYRANRPKPWKVDIQSGKTRLTGKSFHCLEQAKNHRDFIRQLHNLPEIK